MENKKIQKEWSRGRVFLVLTVVWMIIIFCFSAQPGDDSGDLSGSITHLAMQVINTVFQCGWNEIKVLELTEVWHFPIRKLAHMTEFGILALLCYGAGGIYYGAYERKSMELFMAGKRTSAMPTYHVVRMIGAFLIAFLYACSDEFHQLFVPDRAGLLIDVLVDTVGVIIALLLLQIMLTIFGKNKEKDEYIS
ncbi:MAG: VanZ family protein [Lachnospiraceae bacterium]|nr:VanZ family protein [Lachnospiraceae bacterium]